MTTPAGGQEPQQGDNPQGQDPAAGDAGQGQDPGQDQQQSSGPDLSAITDPATRAYVEQQIKDAAEARREAARYRTERNGLQQQVQQFQQQGMTEAERLQAERDAAVERANALEAQARQASLQAAVTAEATALGFHSPTLALRLLDESDVLDDEGKPKNVKAALQAVLKDNPYLAKRSSTADAGEGRGKPADTRSMSALIRAAAGRG